MSLHHRAYRYRLMPTSAQEEVFQRWAGARRFTYNWALARRIEQYKATAQTLTVTELCRELTALKRVPAMAWLREMNAQSLQQAIRDLDKAFARFFARRAGFPTFRSKKRGQPTFRLPAEVRVVGDRLSVPKLGLVRLVLHRPLTGALKSATFKQEASGAWYVTLVTQLELPEVAPPLPTSERTVGVDLGLKDLAVLSDGTRVPAPKHYRRAERKLVRLQRQLSRCHKGGKNREKARIKLARQHQRVANQRRDFLHRLSIQLVRRFEAIVIEDLAVSGLAKTKLGKSIYDAGWSELRFQLNYKAQWYGKRLVVVGRFFPSTRLCPACGAVKGDLTLAERVWRCDCGASHDRDLNAASNIRDQGLRILLAVGATERRNASREPVRPATSGRCSLTEEAPPQAAG